VSGDGAGLYSAAEAEFDAGEAVNMLKELKKEELKAPSPPRVMRV
jgi:hypothetical protein